MGNLLTKPEPMTPPRPSPDRLTLLSRQIGERTRVLAEGLHARGLRAPSYEAGGCPDFPLGAMDAEAVRARHEVLELTRELRDLVLGPREALKGMALDVVNYVPLHAIYAFRIAEAVPRTGHITYEHLSRRVNEIAGYGVPASELRRVLRLAMLNNLFCEPEPGHVAHNCTSLVMLEDEALASWVGLYTEDLFLPVGNTVAAMQKWPGSEDLTETAVSISYNHRNTFFDHTQSDATRAKRYHLAMRAHGSREGFDVAHTVHSYPWAKLGHATVVDMGGNQGYVSMAIAQDFPSLRFEVQDLPGLRTEKTVGQVPAQLASRVRLTTHDFFDEQTTVADAYLFRHIFHAFPDEVVVRILRRLVPALRQGARVIINDVVLPAPGSVPRGEERTFRLLDVLMKTVCNGREREAGDWRAVLERADRRFVWEGAWKSSGNLWFVEAVWDEGGGGGEKTQVGCEV